MKLPLKEISNFLAGVYYTGYAVKVISRIFLKEIFPFSFDDDLYRQYPCINIGEIVETDKYDKVPVSDTLLGTKARMLQSSMGWVIDRYIDEDKPGSIIVYRVLFPEGVFWVSQCWLRKKE